MSVNKVFREDAFDEMVNADCWSKYDGEWERLLVPIAVIGDGALCSAVSAVFQNRNCIR